MPTNLKKKFAEWQKDPAYRKAYDALDGEFAQAHALLAARQRAGLSQAQLAKLIGTSWILYARAHAQPDLAQDSVVKALDAQLRAAASSVEWIGKRWLAGLDG